MSDRAAISEAIIVLRRRAGLKQKALASKAEVSPAHMSRIERGKVEAKRRTLQRIAAALGLSLADFLHFCDELSKSRRQSPPPADAYPPHDAASRRQPGAVAEEEKRVEYFLGLDEEEADS